MKSIKNIAAFIFIVTLALFTPIPLAGKVLFAVALFAANFFSRKQEGVVFGVNLLGINSAASNAGFTGYEGDYGRMYTGYGDDFLDFDGTSAQDFATEMATDRIFQMTLRNNTSIAINVYLNGGYDETGLSTGTNRLITDGNMGASVDGYITGSGAPKTIENFKKFIAANPSSILALQITSTDSTQLDQTISISRLSPFRNLQNELIPISTYRSEFANNDKMAKIRRPFQLDNQTQLSVVVPVGATTTFTFVIGAVLNTAKALASKKEKSLQAPSVQAAQQAMAAAK